MANIRPADVEIRSLNQQQAALLLGVTSRTLRDWPDVPRNADGRTYDGPVLVAWFVAKSGRPTQQADDYDNQRERLAAAQAEKVETENALRRGELADMAAVSQVWTDHILNARAKLLSLPAKLGPQLINTADASTVAARIRTEINAALTELAANVRSESAPADGDPGMVAAA